MRFWTNTCLLQLTLFAFTGCQKFWQPDRGTFISTHGDDESHNKGQNCMDCHYSAGYAEGIFVIAGSVYGNTTNGFIEFYEQVNSTPPILI